MFKKLWLPLIMIVLILITSSCKKNEAAHEPSTDETDEQINAQYQMEGVYSTEGLALDADLIIRGTVTGIKKDYQTNPDGSKGPKGYPLANYPVRIYTVQVHEVYNGAFSESELDLKLVGSSESLMENSYIYEEDSYNLDKPEDYFFLNTDREYLFYLRYQTQEDAARFGDDAGWRLVLGWVGAFEKQTDGTFANAKKGTNHLTLTADQVKKEIAALKSKTTE